MAEDDPGRLFAALSHPMRQSIARAMFGSEKSSPTQLARALGKPLSDVSYHVRALREYGVVELVGTAQGAGSVQHFYRLNLSEPWARAALGLTEGDTGSEGHR